ncbi:MAG: aldo/keto reductase [Actinomycetota bacterium]|nr:aldo/keto reductase [Actinomycetota bacterium]
MEQRRLGNSGLVVSRMALGTMMWGLDSDEDEAGAQTRTFLDAGGTLLDTADVYADGDSERTIGRLLRGSIARNEILLATKAHLATGPGPMDRGSSRGHLLSALENSLHRLGVDHIDLWQLHAFDEGTPLEETLAALDHAVASGKVRYLGISNFSGWQSARAATWQQAWPGRAPIVSHQVEYSLLRRDVEAEVVPAAEALGLGVLPWSPLARGVLTGKYRHATPSDSRGAHPQWAAHIDPLRTPRDQRIVEAVITAADGLGTSPLAVALSWVRDQPGVVAPIVGARTVAQLMGSLAAEDLTLPVEIRQALDDVSAPDGLPGEDDPDG